MPGMFLNAHRLLNPQVRDQLLMLINAGDRCHSPTPVAEFCEKVIVEAGLLLAGSLHAFCTARTC